jgi:hypothetical protein
MKNPVRNLVAVSASNPAAAAAARAAVLALARAKDPETAVEDASGRVVFTVEWEPSFKEIKELSTQHKDVTFTLYGEAFAKQHWVSKTVFQAGKATEDATLSRIDGEAFRRVYQEVFGEPFAAKQ